jgi:SAM-dependent methyltransferase
MHRLKDLSILESEGRKKILPVEPLLKRLERLETKNVAFDIGAGTGYFTIPLARIFKKVYAVDVNPKAIEIISKKGAKNVGAILSEKPPEIDFDIDFVLFADSLHEIEDRKGYANWVKERSKSFAVIDWRRDACTNFGPPLKHRIEIDEVFELFGDVFDLESIDVYECHFFVFGIKTRR